MLNTTHWASPQTVAMCFPSLILYACQVAGNRCKHRELYHLGWFAVWHTHIYTPKMASYLYATGSLTESSHFNERWHQREGHMCNCDCTPCHSRMIRKGGEARLLPNWAASRYQNCEGSQPDHLSAWQPVCILKNSVIYINICKCAYVFVLIQQEWGLLSCFQSDGGCLGEGDIQDRGFSQWKSFPSALCSAIN